MAAHGICFDFYYRPKQSQIGQNGLAAAANARLAGDSNTQVSPQWKGGLTWLKLLAASLRSMQLFHGTWLFLDCTCSASWSSLIVSQSLLSSNIGVTHSKFQIFTVISINQKQFCLLIFFVKTEICLKIRDWKFMKLHNLTNQQNLSWPNS